jgi:hypothetical protein
MEKESATRKTPMQEALDLYHEMQDGLRNRKPKREATSAQQGAKARRQSRKPAEPEARPGNATTPAVQRVESAQAEVEDQPAPAAAASNPNPQTPNNNREDKAQPAPVVAAQCDPAPLASDSGLPATALSDGAEGPIKANQG